MFDGIEKFAQLGSTLVLALAMVWVLWESIKQKKSGGNGNNKNIDILNELKIMNTNHLHAIEMAVRDGNDKIIKTITDGNIKMIEKLSEICGKLNK